ncbi:UNVERIFIED_CONTAM: hypothetical protein HDU68_003115 [Siphonaria sp. JEL0065]|nr:hypothetical protein HDU68_003115 [Siphonaria sp. JEL0065]
MGMRYWLIEIDFFACVGGGTVGSGKIKPTYSLNEPRKRYYLKVPSGTVDSDASAKDASAQTAIWTLYSFLTVAYEEQRKRDVECGELQTVPALRNPEWSEETLAYKAALASDKDFITGDKLSPFGLFGAVALEGVSETPCTVEVTLSKVANLSLISSKPHLLELYNEMVCIPHYFLTAVNLPSAGLRVLCQYPIGPRFCKIYPPQTHSNKPTHYFIGIEFTEVGTSLGRHNTLQQRGVTQSVVFSVGRRNVVNAYKLYGHLMDAFFKQQELDEERNLLDTFQVASSVTSEVADLSRSPELLRPTPLRPTVAEGMGDVVQPDSDDVAEVGVIVDKEKLMVTDYEEGSNLSDKGTSNENLWNNKMVPSRQQSKDESGPAEVGMETDSSASNLADGISGIRRRSHSFDAVYSNNPKKRRTNQSFGDPLTRDDSLSLVDSPNSNCSQAVDSPNGSSASDYSLSTNFDEVSLPSSTPSCKITQLGAAASAVQLVECSGALTYSTCEEAHAEINEGLCSGESNESTCEGEAYDGQSMKKFSNELLELHSTEDDLQDGNKNGQEINAGFGPEILRAPDGFVSESDGCSDIEPTKTTPTTASKKKFVKGQFFPVLPTHESSDDESVSEEPHSPSKKVSKMKKLGVCDHRTAQSSATFRVLDNVSARETFKNIASKKAVCDLGPVETEENVPPAL